MNRKRVRIRIGNAGTKGRGAFACARMPPGTRIVAFTGAPRWIWDIPEELWPYTFQVGYDSYVLPRRGGVGWNINHSCSPNCLVSGRSIITARPIEKGEELTFDYSTDVDWPGFRMNCGCGSEGCRKVVRAYRFLSQRERLRYGRSVADYIWEQYGRKNAHPPEELDSSPISKQRDQAPFPVITHR